MSRSILIAYATKRGSTHEVAESIGETLRAHGLEVDVHPVGELESLTPYDAVVLGGALYMGRLHGDARRFLKRQRDALARLPVATFAMGPGTLDETAVAGSRKQLERALARVPEVEPVSVAIFGGVVDPTTLRFPFNHMPATDARDWEAIHAWAEEVADLLGQLEPAAAAASR